MYGMDKTRSQGEYIEQLLECYQSGWKTSEVHFIWFFMNYCDYLLDWIVYFNVLVSDFFYFHKYIYSVK